MKYLRIPIGAALVLALSLLLVECKSDPRLTEFQTKDTSGDPQRADSVIRIFPSATLPPVVSPYLFYWDFGPGPSFTGSVANAQGAGDEAQAVEHRKAGKLAVFWTYGPQWPYGKSKEDFVAYYLATIRSQSAYLVDEWQRARFFTPAGNSLSMLEPFGIRGAIEGIVQAKKCSPGSFILIAWRGENSLLPLVQNGNVDCLLIEAYSHLTKNQPQNWAMKTRGVDTRIAKARSWGIIDRTIPWLGEIRSVDEYAQGRPLTTAELEAQIRHYREVAPEMPGCAFYGNTNDELARAADALCRKYFVDPAPDVAIVNPPGGAVLSPTWHTIKAIATTKGGRTVREYRGFIDNRLVYIGYSPAFEWNFAQETRGSHYITVHVADGMWNRGVAQIRIDIR